MHDYSYKRHASSDRLDQRLGNLSACERRDLVPDLPLGHGVHQVSLKYPTFGYPRAPGTRRFISLVDGQGLRDDNSEYEPIDTSRFCALKHIDSLALFRTGQ
jgi:hypothetical protein